MVQYCDDRRVGCWRRAWHVSFGVLLVVAALACSLEPSTQATAAAAGTFSPPPLLPPSKLRESGTGSLDRAVEWEAGQSVVFFRVPNAANLVAIRPEPANVTFPSMGGRRPMHLAAQRN